MGKDKSITRRVFMSLHVDPSLTVELLKKGHFSEEEARLEIQDLTSEISCGIYSLEQLGLQSEQEIQGLLSRCQCRET
ncbi:MAG: hypothetical protein WAV16_01670 [Candidatus Moraniibacteriota bacterium]